MNGKGVYEKHTGEKIDGTFKNNKPEGYCDVTSDQDWTYKGNMVNGLKNGQGIYENTKIPEIYEGGFANDLYEGEGLYRNDKIGLIYEGIFKEGEMTLVPNFVKFF
jgi:hypothetical protein